MILNQLYPKNKISIPHGQNRKKTTGCKHIVQLTTFKELIKQLNKLKWKILRIHLSRNQRKGKNPTNLSYFQPKSLNLMRMFVNSQKNLCSKLHSSHLQSQKNHYIHLLLAKHNIKTLCNGISKNHYLLWSKNL